MKVIKSVKPVPVPVDPWPIGMQVTCENCKCVYEIETMSDVYNMKGPNGLMVRTYCPECKTANEVKDKRQK